MRACSPHFWFWLSLRVPDRIDDPDRAPVVVWCWTWMDTLTAVLLRLHAAPPKHLDNILKPLVMARGPAFPTLVILSADWWHPGAWSN